MLIEKQKYLHMQKFLPIEAEIYTYSKTISINQRIAQSYTLGKHTITWWIFDGCRMPEAPEWDMQFSHSESLSRQSYLSAPFNATINLKYLKFDTQDVSCNYV